jgi:2-dehydro-3-deoxyphosphogluconate aldolase/(4S)-4-hydroxy-2-oxoglutarate aldolase
MRNKGDILEHIRRTGLVPVLRANSAAQGFALAEAILEGGVDVLEVTMTVPGATQLISRLVREQPSILVGAGTVLNAEQARACLGEGAQFIVSPAFDAPTVKLCRDEDVAVLPGALTPTEVLAAWNAGADIVKVFPASAMGGASYLRSLRAPLPQVKVIPTGGVSLTTAKDFLEAGAYALGVGADLVDLTAIDSGGAGRITEHARKYVAIIREFQQRLS